MSFGTRELFDIDRLEIYEGDRIGLVGLNGSGKTTLLKILMGEITPDEGRVRIHCEPRYFTQLNEERENTATAVELSLFGVQELTERDEVSGGEDTRLRLAELFSEDTELYILDEPTNYLDIPSVEAIQELLMEYEGTMLFVSHDNEFVKAIATDVIRIENMKLINEIR